MSVISRLSLGAVAWRLSHRATPCGSRAGEGVCRRCLQVSSEGSGKDDDDDRTDAIQLPTTSTAHIHVPRPLPLPRPFPACFDTHQVICDLQKAGFTPQQSEAVVVVLNGTLRSTIDTVTTSQITQRELEILELRVQREVDGIRNSLVLLEKSTVVALRNENESLKAQIQKLKDSVKEEVGKVESGVKLDLNLERGRVKEESTLLEQKIKDTNNKIGTEVAQLRTRMESQKVESIKYLAGGIFSIITIILSVVLGLWRLMK